MAVIAGITLVVLIGVAALAVDAGSLFTERRKLQTAADAAALAGVQDLPASPAKAIAHAQAYVAANAAEATDVNVQVSSSLASNDTVRVAIDTPDSPLFFARILDKTSSPVHAVAAARVTSPSSYGAGVMPFGILAKNLSAASGWGYAWDELVRIKQSDGTTGNFDLMSLSYPPGANWGNSDVKSTIQNGGTAHPVYSDTIYSTAAGNKSTTTSAMNAWIGGDAHTFAEICPPPDENGVVHVNLGPGDVERCHRLILCPIVIAASGDPFAWPNGNTDMKVIGFAEFFVESVGSTGKDCWIDCRLVKTVSVDQLDPNPVNTSGQVHYALTE